MKMPSSLLRTYFLLTGSMATLLPGIAPAEQLKTSQPAIDAILRENCIRCHGPEKQKGDLRLDQLNRDLANGGDADRWHEVLNQIAAGDMPPPKEKPIPSSERQALTAWLRAGLEEVALAKHATGGTVTLRRLTKEEYQHTMEDLLGLQIDFASELPPDPLSKDGFLNNGETLLMSGSQMETYVAVAQRALDKCFDTRGADKSIHYTFTGKEGEKSVSEPEGKKPSKLKTSKKGMDDPFLGLHEKTSPRFLDYLTLTSVSGAKDGKKAAGSSKAWTYPSQNILPGHEMICGLDEWPTSGEMLVRIRVASDGQKAIMPVKMGYKSSEMVIDSKLVGSAMIGDEQLLEFRVRMDSIPVVPPNGKSKFAAQLVFIGNDSLSASLTVKSLEIMSLPAAANDKHPLASGTPEAILRAFVPKAWRRPVSDAEIQGLLRLHGQMAKAEPKTALRDTLAVVLSSANFLYLTEPRAPAVSTMLTEHELAARLSYLLWSTMPDEELRRLADAGQLRKQLGPQFTRLLNDKRSDRFVRSFVYQWLDLNGLERVAVNPEYFSHYTDDLKADSAEETYAFFNHILRHDLPATNLIKSSFVTVNDRVAQHYGIQNVAGSDFRPVPAPPHRGGLLTQASILTATANGVDSHPIKRGNWILQTLLNDPPPPPPPNVPMLDEAKAQAQGLTIAQQLAEHRNNAACADCHQKIDPWGLALENFNAIGLWRDSAAKPAAQSVVAQKPLKKKAAKKAGQDKANAADENSSRTEPAKPAPIASKTPVEQLQQRLLVERGDDFARAFVSKLLTYALGRSLDFADAKSVDALTATFKADNFNIRLLMARIVLSNAFQRN